MLLPNQQRKMFNAWLQLDFKEKDKNDNFKVKQFHSGYGYELEPVLNRYPIKELANDEEMVRLIKSLEKGNQHQTEVESLKKYGLANVYSAEAEALRRAQAFNEFIIKNL